MAKKVSPVPKGYRTATPTLVVRGADAAIAYYESVFGAEVLSRTVAQDGASVLVAEIRIGNSIIRISDEMPAFGVFSPVSLGGTPVGLHLYLSNVDEVWEQALLSGATVIAPLADVFWGERYGRFIDPFGHVWSLARRIEAKSAEEIAAQYTAGISVVEPDADEVAPVAGGSLVVNADIAPESFQAA